MINLPFLLEITVKASAILVAAAALRFLLRRSSAAARQLVLTLACAALLFLPLASLALRPIPPRFSPVPAGLIQTTPWLATPQPAPPTSASAASAFPWRQALVIIYSAGATLILLRFLGASLRIRRVVRGAVLFGQSAHVPLLLTDRLPLPVTWGLWRPVILLPQAAPGWPAERLRLVVAHEMAHIRRWDFLGQVAAQLACALYWFHPLAWWAARQLVKEREQACDDEVLNMGVTATNYAEHLMSIVKSARGSSGAWSPAIGMAHGTAFEGRLSAMLNPRLNRRSPRRGAVLAGTLIAVALLVPLAALHLRAQSAAASILGVVHDPSGAAVPHARVLATNTTGANVEAAYTADDGTYQIQGVRPGRYNIEIKAPGFEAARQTGVDLAGGAHLQFDATFQLGSLNETVEVVGKRSATLSPTAPQRTPQRIRVGGMVQASKLLNKVPPVYPESALQNGKQGTVLLHAVIGTDGRLLSLAASSASSDHDLTQAAIDAVRLWTYEPTLLNGEPVEVVTTIAVNFRLE